MGWEPARLLHGGDYNPEQWLHCPEILTEDIRLMKEAHVNCVTLGVFSWATLEPARGEWNFGWLERIVDRLYAQGIGVILATPTGAMPHWLTQEAPQVLQTTADGRRNLPGRRHNFCASSPVMRERAALIDGELARRFCKHPGLVAWHLSNEYGGNFADSSCHCELCQTAFRAWLKEKYGDLETLNHSWWTTFWSHTYTSFEQIHSPAPHGESMLTGLTLDWRRFVSAQLTDFMELEIRSLRRYSDRPVTTNFMDFFKPVDYHKMQEPLDIVSWDAYPAWHSMEDELPVAVRAAAGHSLMRSMKKAPFLLMESVPSGVNWRPFNPVKRPGMHELSSLQALACGADSVQYFQWRKGRGGYEKLHGAVLDHRNGADTRVFCEVRALGERLEKLSDRVKGTCNRARAAIIFDWENWWALEETTGPRLDLSYVDAVLTHYRPFWEKGIDVDFLPMDASLEGYALVTAPLNYMYKEGYAGKVGRYVENGGTYITTCYSGVVDETDLCLTGKHPLEEVLGVCPQETDAPGDSRRNTVQYKGRDYAAGRLCEVIGLKGAETLAEYGSDYYKGCPAVTVHAFGKGKACYLAADFSLELLREFYGDRMRESGLMNAFAGELPCGVTVNERMRPMRSRADETSLLFVQNFNPHDVEFPCNRGFYDVETGEKTERESVCRLGAFACRIYAPDSGRRSN